MFCVRWCDGVRVWCWEEDIKLEFFNYVVIFEINIMKKMYSIIEEFKIWDLVRFGVGEGFFDEIGVRFKDLIKNFLIFG